MGDHLEAFAQDMRAERDYQRAKWGDAFDARNTPNDWIAYIAQYAGKAVTLPWDAVTFRTMLVKVATLCAAACEQLDRTGGQLPKRHYD